MLAEMAAGSPREPPEVRARVPTVPGGPAVFGLDRRFPLVMIAMNTLQVLTDPADRLACLTASREHLAAGAS